VGLAFLKNREKDIFSKKTEEIFYLMSSEIYQIKDIDAFMNLAYSFEITAEKVRQLGNEFDKITTEKMR
jgi:hypothetical protein